MEWKKTDELSIIVGCVDLVIPRGSVIPNKGRNRISEQQVNG